MTPNVNSWCLKSYFRVTQSVNLNIIPILKYQSTGLVVDRIFFLPNAMIPHIIKTSYTYSNNIAIKKQHCNEILMYCSE